MSDRPAPIPQAKILISCRGCGAEFSAPAEMAGRETKCRTCKAPLTVPGGKPLPAPRRRPQSSLMQSPWLSPPLVWLPIGGLLLTLFLAALLIAAITPKRASQQGAVSAATTATATVTTGQANNDRVYGLNEVADVGDVRVHVTSAVVGSIGAVSPGGTQYYSTDSLLAIRLGINNVNPRKAVAISGADDADLKDDLGNDYSATTIRTEFGFACVPNGAISRHNLYSDKPATDCLVFSRPVQGANYLLLKINARHYGGEGTITFKIPSSAWRR